MVNVYKGIQQRLQQLSLSQRLIVGLVVALIAIIIFSGLPANIAMWVQLERQAWGRIEDAQAATQALYENEIARLAKRAELFAGRPTLQGMLQEGDTIGMASYLETLKVESGNVDVVRVVTPDFQVGDVLEGLPDPKAFLGGQGASYADFVSLSQPARLFIVGVSQIRPGGEDSPVVGWVLVARQQTAEEMQLLEKETGLEQSLIVDGTRVATSLSGAPIGALDPECAARVTSLGEPTYRLCSDTTDTYYVGVMPIQDSLENVVALSEVALPAGAIRRGMIETIALSAGLSLLVMVVGSLLVVRQARTITRPLQELSQAAEQISKGNLETPTPINTSLPEIDRLAHHFDLARRQMRQTLAVTQREMKHVTRLLSSVREGVVALDKDQRISFINSDAEEILGYPSEKALHHHYSRIFQLAPGETCGLKEILSQAKSDSAVHRVSVLDARGNPLLLAIKVSCLEGDIPDGHESECVLVIRDVTEEEAVGRLRYNFLANVAHEFRTPLSGISATTELMVEESSTLTSVELLHLVETIRLSTLHLQTLVDNLLESTTIEAGCFKVHCYPISMGEVIQRAASLMAPLLNRRAQKLEISYTPDLPTLWADPNRLTQVLVNLLSNASKFSPMDGKIELVISQDTDWLTVAVLDSGPGLPDGRFADVFKRYVSTNQLHDTQYGIGLGLSVVKTIVEVHGGQVGAENRAAGGANVWFTIPIHPSEEIENA